MENNNEEKAFSYTYSAKEQAELKRIREKYTSPIEEENKMMRLRRLDASVTKSARIVAITMGIIGALILGFGMSLIMTDLSVILGQYENMAIVIGIVIGVVGCVIVSLAYPIYNVIVKARRKRLAPEIIRLADELIK